MNTNDEYQLLYNELREEYEKLGNDYRELHNRHQDLRIRIGHQIQETVELANSFRRGGNHITADKIIGLVK